MAATNETGLAALEQHRAHNRERQAQIDRELARDGHVEEIGPLCESSAVLIDVGLKRVRGARCVPERRAIVRTADCKRQVVGDRV